MTDGPGYAPPPPGHYVHDHPRAVVSLVLGILALVLCQLIGPFAWVIGKRTVSEIDAAPGAYTGRGMARAGHILGIVATALLGLSVAYLVVALAVLSSAAFRIG